MQIVRTVAEMRRATAGARRNTWGLNAPILAPLSYMRPDSTQAPRLGLVPTMGALHEGHLSLVRAARQACSTVVVSIFVNPTQFAPGEDLDRYPRTFDADRKLLEYEGADILFAPSVAEMYPPGGTATVVEVQGIGDRLDGASRPGHFRGVATVVSKLFNIVQPDIAFFGQKDAAQLAVLRSMVRDLNIPVELRSCATIRDPDGLALSSRNRYLSAEDRKAALALSRALHEAEEKAARGTTSSAELLEGIRSTLAATPELRLEYAEIVDPDTLLPLEQAGAGALIAIAAWVGTTRLIDNVLLGSKL